jgi:ACS family tartrate transporter-like MFS transporter
MRGAEQMPEIETRTMSKVAWRLVPFLMLCYFIAYLDRVNIGFAGASMSKDLGLSAGVFGGAAGIFFIAYFFFEVPSNMALDRFGARIWIARIMLTWGLIAGAQAFVTGEYSLKLMRLLLGVAEAGFFPGLLLYFTYWFPTYHHARIVSGFLIGLPIAVAGGAPISTALLGLDGLFGLRGWQIMYIAEGVPTVLIGIVTLFVLTDRPAQAKFLTVEEKTWLSAKLDSERKAKEAVRTFSMLQGMFDLKVLLLALNYFGIVVASLGILFFVPQIIKSIGVTDNMTVGWLTMIPYISGGIGLVTWGLVSDRMNERRWNLLAACAVSAVGLIIAGLTIGSWWAMVGLSIAAFGFYGSKGPFWSMPPMFLTGTAAAASIAWINSLGNLGGFFGPWYVGVIKDWTDSYAGGLYGLAFLCVMSAVVCALFLHIPNPTVTRGRTAALAAE